MKKTARLNDVYDQAVHCIRNDNLQSLMQILDENDDTELINWQVDEYDR